MTELCSRLVAIVQSSNNGALIMTSKKNPADGQVFSEKILQRHK